MKKTYIAPESALFTINLSEKIATSPPSSGIGDDKVSGSLDIYFTHGGSGCRGYYYGEFDAPVSIVNGSWLDYFLELHGMNKPAVLQKCIGASS